MTDGPRSWLSKNTASSAQHKATQSVGCYHNSTTRPLSQYRQDTIMLINRTNHHVDETKQPITPNTSPRHLAIEAKRQRLRATRTTYVRTWTIEPARPDQSTDQGDVPQHETTTIKPGTTSITKFGSRTEYGRHLNPVVMWPDIEAPHTPCALPMR